MQDTAAALPIPEGWTCSYARLNGEGKQLFTIRREEGSTIGSGPRAPVIEGYECYFVGHSPDWTSYSYRAL